MQLSMHVNVNVNAAGISIAGMAKVPINNEITSVYRQHSADKHLLISCGWTTRSRQLSMRLKKLDIRHVFTSSSPVCYKANSIDIPSTRPSALGDRVFSVAATCAWNTPPSTLRAVPSLQRSGATSKQNCLTLLSTVSDFSAIIMRVLTFILYSALVTALLFHVTLNMFFCNNNNNNNNNKLIHDT